MRTRRDDALTNRPAAPFQGRDREREVNDDHSRDHATNTEITIRRMDSQPPTSRALRELAALDSHAPLDGPVLGAEVEGELRAAISVATGELSPTRSARTSELGALLRLRADQLRAQRGQRSRRPRAALRRARLALGGSPPGEILSLPRAR